MTRVPIKLDRLKQLLARSNQIIGLVFRSSLSLSFLYFVLVIFLFSLFFYCSFSVCLFEYYASRIVFLHSYLCSFLAYQIFILFFYLWLILAIFVFFGDWVQIPNREHQIMKNERAKNYTTSLYFTKKAFKMLGTLLRLGKGTRLAERTPGD